MTSVVLMGLVINNAIRKSNARSKKAQDEFWKKERDSYRAPERSTDDLDFVKVPDNLPIHISTDDPRIKEYQEILDNLTKKDIIDLSGISNTDIRMSYGNKNLEELSKADQRYITLCRTLTGLSSSYIKAGYEGEARELLEFAVSIGCDITACWQDLGRLYLRSEDRDSLEKLIEKAEALEDGVVQKREILSSLKEIQTLMDIVA
ncbi:MAG: hypothetical protein K5668_01950 [Lachnospiraceae bacterium]|nr:hypothetical protein [Lachnospiraceae bacterium]